MEYLKGMSQAMKQAQADNTSESYGYVATELVKSKNDIRQAIEQATAGAVAAIIGKLENNQPLTDAEKQTVKLWVVGDAEGYVKMENNFQDWLQEYRRLMDVIAAWEVQDRLGPGTGGSPRRAGRRHQGGRCRGPLSRRPGAGGPV